MTDTPFPAEVRDFTVPMEPHRFRIDVDVFAAPAILAPVNMVKIAKLVKQLPNLEISSFTEESMQAAVDVLSKVFEALMPGPSAARMAERLQADGSDPATPSIDLLRQAIPALHYLLECYGMRPTQQSSPLLSESMTGASTVGAPPEVSTGEESEASPSS